MGERQCCTLDILVNYDAIMLLIRDIVRKGAVMQKERS
jgi:hypothetical protein